MDFAFTFHEKCAYFLKDFCIVLYEKSHTRRERERERAPRKASGVDSATFFTWILSYFSGDMCILFERLRCAFPGKTDRGRSPRQASGIDFGILFTWILSYFSEEDCISFEKLLHFFPEKPILEERDRERGRSPRKASGVDFGTHFTWILLLLFMRNVQTF